MSPPSVVAYWALNPGPGQSSYPPQGALNLWELTRNSPSTYQSTCSVAEALVRVAFNCTVPVTVDPLAGDVTTMVGVCAFARQAKATKVRIDFIVRSHVP